MKKQVVVIHGGDPARPYAEYIADLKNEEVDADDFKEKRRWRTSLQNDVCDGFEVFSPRMPNSGNAKYSEWKIWFEKMIPFLRADAILIGHSLGGIFLAKYFSENVFPCKVRAIFLLAAPYWEKKKRTKDSSGGFAFGKDLSLITEQAKDVYLYHSSDDPIVPFGHLKKFKTKLPAAHPVLFKDKGHFTMEKFPELIKAVTLLS